MYIISGQLNTFDWPIYVWSKQSPSHVPLGFVSSHLNSFWIGQTLGQLYSHSCFADWKIGDIKNKTLIILQNKYYSVQTFYSTTSDYVVLIPSKKNIQFEIFIGTRKIQNTLQLIEVTSECIAEKLSHHLHFLLEHDFRYSN